MPASATVIPIGSRSAVNAIDRITQSNLPTPVYQVRDTGKHCLLKALRAVFDNADDALFELADSATSNHDQNLFFESMREVRMHRRQMETDFKAAIESAFAHLANNTAVDESCGSEEFSTDNLSLVQHDELEELVAVDSMITKAANTCGENLQHLSLRLDSLVPLKVYQKNNPVGPDVVCNAFAKTAKVLDIDIKAKLVLFRLFEKYVVKELGATYETLNALLIEQDILPSLKNQKPKKKSPPASARVESGKQGSPTAVVNAAEALVSQSSLGDRSTADSLLAAASNSSSDPIAETTDDPAPSAAVSNHQLLNILSNIQHQHGESGGGSTAASVTAVKLDIATLLMQALQAKDKQQQIANNDRDVINLVKMLFEFILDDRNLAGPMKALIGRLQIPVLKVAMIDPTFFSKGGHPARRLLNEMATAALGWQEETSDSEALSKDPLYKKIAEVVQRILNDFESDVAIFTDVLADFMSFVDKERKRAKILEQRTIDAESGKAKAEAARLQVAQSLDVLAQDATLPEAVQKILDVAWSNVLFLLCINEGTESDRWRASLQTAKDLIWSVTAPVNAENRQQLLELLPRLLKQLRSGLESVAYNPFEMTQLLSQLEKIHLERLKSTAEAQNLAAGAKTAVAGSQDVGKSVVSEPAPLASTSKDKEENTGPHLQVVTNNDAKSKDKPTKKSSKQNTASDGNVVDLEPRDPVTLGSDADAGTNTTSTPLCHIDENEPVEEEFLHKVSKLTQGTWFEMDEGGGKKFRCRLAAIIKAADKFIFVNRGGLKVAEKTTKGLALSIKYGHMRLLDDGMLFDRALQSVIGDLRNTRRA